MSIDRYIMLPSKQAESLRNGMADASAAQCGSSQALPIFSLYSLLYLDDSTVQSTHNYRHGQMFKAQLQSINLGSKRVKCSFMSRGSVKGEMFTDPLIPHQARPVQSGLEEKIGT